jgi:hypothetical protein
MGNMAAETDNPAHCKVSKVRDPSFYNSTIANFSCPAEGFAVAYAKGAEGAANKSYQVCAWAKGTGKLFMSMTGVKTVGGSNRTYMVTASKYNQYCSGFLRLNNSNQ